MRTNVIIVRFVMIMIVSLCFMGQTAFSNDVIRSKKVPGQAKAEKKEVMSYAMTEMELQLNIMGFADRFATIMTVAVEDFNDLSPSLESRRLVYSDAAYATAAAFTTAAAPDPDTAVLDMVVMVTLGRMIYQDDLQKKFGDKLEPIITAYRILENDIWQIVSKVLNKQQQNRLRATIKKWRERHPDLLAFSHVRFSDFERDKRKAIQTKTKKKSGLFASVEDATRQVEEVRLMAERGMFMASRLPLLTGMFTNVWATMIIRNPEVNEVIEILRRFSDVSDRMTTLMEQFPDQLAKERDITVDRVMNEVSRLRQTTIDQVMGEVNDWTDKTVDNAAKRVSMERDLTLKQLQQTLKEERQEIVKALTAQGTQINGLLVELQKALAAGNVLMGSATALSERLGFDASKGGLASLDIDAYQKTATEVAVSADRLNTLVGTVDRLLQSPSLEKILPVLDQSMKSVGKEGEKIINHTFRQAIILILIWLVGYVLARFAYTYLSAKYVRPASR